MVKNVVCMGCNELKKLNQNFVEGDKDGDIHIFHLSILNGISIERSFYLAKYK